MQDGPSNSNYQITTTNQHDLHFPHPLAPSQQNPHSQQPLQHHLQPLLLGQPDVFSAVEAGSYISKGRRLCARLFKYCAIPMPFTFETGNNLPRCEPISSLQKKPLSANTSGQFRPSKAQPAPVKERQTIPRLGGLVADPRDAERPPQHRRPQTGNPPQTEKDAPTISPLVFLGPVKTDKGTRKAAIFQSCERRTRSARNEHFRAIVGSPKELEHRQYT